MTDFIRDRIDHQLDAVAPPSDLDSGDLARRGRRRVLRRRLGVGGVTAALLAAVVTGGLLLVPGGGTTAVPPAATQPSYPLPATVPGADYEWQPGDGPQSNTATRELTKAFWDLIDALPNATPVAYDSNEQTVGAPLTEADFRPFSRRVDRLDVDQKPSGYTRPVYGQFHFLQFRAGQPDTMSVSLYPAGSFDFGAASDPEAPTMPDWRHVEEGCGRQEFAFRGEPGWVQDVACSEDTGPGGERILRLQQATTSAVGRTTYVNVLLVQIADGNLIRIADQGPVPVSPTEDGPRPGLDTDGLLALALALPKVIID